MHQKILILYSLQLDFALRILMESSVFFRLGSKARSKTPVFFRKDFF